MGKDPNERLSESHSETMDAICDDEALWGDRGPMRRDGKLKLVVVERNPLIVSALRELIIADQRFAMVGCLSSGAAFIDALTTTCIAFDVALVSWRLADMDADEVLLELRRRELVARIVVFRGESDSAVLKRCVRLGAQGFCYEDDDASILVETLLAVANNRICIPHIDLARVNETPLSALTVRELELLTVLSDGWSNLQIAARTGISENTVKYHLKNLYGKLGARNRAMAVAIFAGERSHRFQTRTR